ncbi:hypothetical protein GUT189_08790 [Streptococcus ruminantium]|nr:hypothetical protein GUT183_09460 [Streptococcus ruminantium]BDD42546.1 hypothetical protein GUT189_08790 [Streptococcus ruminantium]
MKLNANDKVEIYYHLKQLGWTWPQLSQRFNVTKVHLQYLVRLIDKHGLDCAQKGKNNYYSPELKEKIINEVLLRGRSQLDVSLDYALPSRSTLPTWIAQYKKNGYTILFLGNQEEGYLKWDVNQRKLGKK